MAQKKETVADYCGGCTFDLHYCMESFGSEVTPEIKKCGFNKMNRDTNPLWKEFVEKYR